MMCVSMLSCFSYVQFFATLWTMATPVSSVHDSQKRYWNGLPCPPPQGSSLLRDHTHISNVSFHWPAVDSLPLALSGEALAGTTQVVKRLPSL